MIKDIFKKDINRKIEGVIKADMIDDASVFNEVDEYVVTSELNKKFDNFFDVYAGTIGKPSQSVGVWISGFFGSGKSHLLKILSYILSSRSVNADLIGELFLGKIDKDDFELISNIQKSLDIKADTLLFNIDTKADSGAGNRSENAILQVFLKVFNEHREYYPKQPSVANFEKQLDDKGKYQAFQDAFLGINGNSWVEERDALTFIIDDAAKAFSQVQNISFESALEQLNKLDETFTVSIEDFAKDVKAYIETKEPNYRLIFLVDEVGQFIGENTSVMLNLQSMVESLGSICQGQAWVVVTSQSAIKNLISSHAGLENDFSKIMGRFDVKLDLTSQNANEVIQKRLLTKDESALPMLSKLYKTHQNSIKSIIHFSDRGIQYKNYENEDDFSLTYPFVPYQLDLFQRCMIGLSDNEIFQGRHASIGERSMLNVVQKVALDISNEEVGTLASFDYFFDGISNIIRPELQTQITLAHNSLDNFTLKVLKTLFLVKYVDGFSSNIQNITTLLVDSLDVNVAELTKKVKNSLSTLLSQVYIQKVGDVYEFLTNVEKDIENEIKRVDIEDTDTSKELADWIYEDIIKISKVRYEKNKHDYAFTRKLDGVKVKGNDEELMLDIITPLNSEEYTTDRLIHKSLAENDIIINLGHDYDFVQDMRTYIQTKKFIPLRQGGNLTDQERYILQTKGTDNQKRKKELIEKLKLKFEESGIYHSGFNLPKTTTDARKLIENLFNEIIPTTYAHIGMLNIDYNEKQIDVIVDGATDLFGKDDAVLDPASEEINTYLKRAKASSQSVTILDLINKYSKRPYGWFQAGIQCTLAKLFSRELITVTLNGDNLDAGGIKRTLKNSREFHALVKVATVVDEKELKKAREILGELFSDVSFANMNGMSLLENVKELSTKRLQKLENYANLDYPFKDGISEFLAPYKTLKDSNIETLFDRLGELEDTLLDQYEDDVSKIIEFMEHDQRKIYDNCKNFVRDNHANIRHFDSTKLKSLEEILKDKNVYKDNKLPDAKLLKLAIEEAFVPMLQQAKDDAVKKLDTIIETLQNDDNFETVPNADKHKVIRPVQYMQTQIQDSSAIDSIATMSSDSTLLIKGLGCIEELMPTYGDTATTKRIHLDKLTQKGKRLKTREDVDTYINELKKELLKAIDDSHEILT